MPDDQSKVLTLVFTDLADSTALKREKGDAVADALITRHRDHVVRLAEESAGRVIDWAGDGCFLTFDTSSAAVMFALRLQQVHAEEVDLPGVRVGIHMGEVTEKTGHDGNTQIKGLAVDIAARIQSLAKPGQVLLSAAVYDSARQRIGVDALGKPVLWQAHGAYTLKGFDKPLDIGEAGFEGLSPLAPPEASEKAQPLVPVSPRVEVMPPQTNRSYWMPASIGIVLLGVVFAYWFGDLGTGPPPSVELDAPITSLAVLPLDNLSAEPDQRYFTDGMTEAITAELAKIKALKVVSRTSSQRYRDTDLSLPEIAAELNVEGLIEGSVQRDGESLRIIVQLVDARNDTHTWSETYDGSLTGVLKLQSEVALAIADALRAELTSDERQRIAAAQDVDPAAYDLYLQAIHEMSDVTPAGLMRVRQLFARAAEADPTYADAWAGVAISNILLGAFGAGPPSVFFERSREAAERALELDDTLGEAEVALALAEVLLDLEWDRALERVERAQELNPNSFFMSYFSSVYYMIAGDWTKAREHAEHVIELNPNAPYPLTGAAIGLMFTGDVERGRLILEAQVAKNPSDIQASLSLGWALLIEGEFEAAMAEYRRVQGMTGPIPMVVGLEVLVQALNGQDEQARQRLQQMTASGSPETIAISALPWAYYAIGESDTAFEWLEKAAEKPSGLYLNLLRNVPFLTDLPGTQAFATMPGNPRYWRLIERLQYPRLPPEHPGYEAEQAWLARKAAEAEASAPIEKLAVLPFSNMMNDPDQEYFVDGMTEALITELAQIRAIQVRGRTSIMRYKDTDKSIPEIARELDVDGIIEGSVLREGDEVRITTQLIHAPSDTHRWAESYDSTVTSILKLHSDMALAIAREVEANLTPQEQSRIAEVRDVIPAAYEQVLLARQATDQQSREGFEAAERYARQALAIDPNFAEAHSALANALWIPTIWGWGNSAEPIAEVRSLLARAQELDSDNAMVLTSTGWVALVYDHNWPKAWDLFQRATELEPNAAWHRGGLSWCHATAREYDAALEEAQHAVELDPYSAQPRDCAGDVYSMTGRTEAAVDYREETLRLFPDHLGTLMDLVHEYPLLGREDDFDRVVDRITAIDDGSNSWLFANGYGIFGREEEVREILADAERVGDKAAAFWVAAGYAALGDADKAFEWLNRSYEKREFALITLGSRYYPVFDPYRDDPRYQAILDKLNFPKPRPEYQ